MVSYNVNFAKGEQCWIVHSEKAAYLSEVRRLVLHVGVAARTLEVQSRHVRTQTDSARSMISGFCGRGAFIMCVKADDGTLGDGMGLL